jgi:hypothetical protein
MNPTCLEPSTVNGRSRGRERREWPRFACHLHALCRIAKSPRSPVFEGTVVNLSGYGAAVLVSQELGRGTEVSIRLFNAAGEAACDCSSRVIHSRPVSGGWIMGCQFATHLDQTDLDRLLSAPA